MVTDGLHAIRFFATFSISNYVYTEDFDINVVPFITPPGATPSTVYYVIGTVQQTIPFADLDYSTGITAGKSLTNI